MITDDRLPIATALRRSLAQGYGLADLQADVLAGLVVGIVALPLSMALAIAVGAPPQHGLYTAIFAGFVTALLGGCRFQVTGPTAAFVVILAPILQEHGLSGLLTSGLMAGGILMALGLARMGTVIRFVPYPVTTGFTAGIATVIATLQVKDLLGLTVPAMPEPWHLKVLVMWQARGTWQPAELLVGAATLALLLAVPRYIQKVPAPLIAVAGVSLAVALLSAVTAFDVATIGDRFASEVGGVRYVGVPPVLPRPALPWDATMSFALLRDLVSSAVAIALLGAIESLLSGVIADGMTGTRHDPNAELFALGVGNVVAPFFGGIAATGALARTATNIRAGARTPVAAMVHAIVILLALLVLAPLVAYVPMATLAALLLLVAWNMSEVWHFVSLVRIAPKSDVFVLVTCFLLTVLVDMTVAVSVGFLLAAVLFIRRMSEITEASWVGLDRTEEASTRKLPAGVALYAINGPLFFGAAQKALDALHAAHQDTFRVLVLDLGRVAVIDATGFAALENVVRRLTRETDVVLAGPLPRPDRLFERGRLQDRFPRLAIEPSLDRALDRAAALAHHAPPAGAPPGPPEP